MRRPNRGSGSRTPRPQVPLDVGQKLRDTRESKLGVVVDCARQYSHPKAQPVLNYLVRWEDGQVEAISEAAIGASHGIEAVD